MGRLGRALNHKKQTGRSLKQTRASSCLTQCVNPSKQKLKTFEQRQIAKRDSQATKDLEKELMDIGKKKRIAKNKKLAEKKKRKETNEIMSGSYQVIKNTSKINRWNKKAKRQLVKMSEEQVAKLMERKK